VERNGWANGAARAGHGSVPGARPPKGSFVKDLVEGEEVEGVFLVRRKSVRRTREGRPFLALALYDRSGVVDGHVWDDSEAFAAVFAERDFVRVRGYVDRYRERLQLRVVTCATCRWEDLAAEDFLPASARSPDDMLEELRGRVRSVADPWLRALLEAIQADTALMKAIVLSPAATAVHHDRLGGLLEHTLTLMALCDAVTRTYADERTGGRADLDRDLLLTGAFLHDLGKVRELQPVPGFPYTDEGQLLGHIVLGYEIAMRKADGVPGFPPELRMRLGHLVLSHQGELEWGSPKRPKTLEALVLHHLDNLDSKVEVFRKAAGTASGGWTDYVRTLGRALYVGGAEAAADGPGGAGGARDGRVADGPSPAWPDEQPPEAPREPGGAAGGRSERRVDVEGAPPDRDAADGRGDHAMPPAPHGPAQDPPDLFGQGR
jgi:3'-5' exoribonuclease